MCAVAVPQASEGSYVTAFEPGWGRGSGLFEVRQRKATAIINFPRGCLPAGKNLKYVSYEKVSWPQGFRMKFLYDVNAPYCTHHHCSILGLGEMCSKRSGNFGAW